MSAADRFINKLSAAVYFYLNIIFLFSQLKKSTKTRQEDYSPRHLP